jgi:TolB-like protein/Flp pilus assembly protein TadD
MNIGSQDREADSLGETTVFVSYSRGDQKRALPIIKILAAAGFAVWWDGLLEGGERFSRTTEDALERAKAIVVLWSANSSNSHWVHDEATRGRDRKCLVPLSIDGSEPPLGFRQFQVIEASQAKVKTGSPEMQKLVRAVAALHDRPSDFAASNISNAPRISRRTLVIGGGTVAVIGSGLAAWLSGLVGGKSIAATSVAVMPFDNLSGDPKQAYFSDGLAAEVRSELTRNALLQVAAQTSSNNFRDRKDDIKAIAQKLGVAFLLEGSVRRSGDVVRIDTQLINGRTGVAQWSDRFDRSMANIFEVQSEIATAIATELSAQIDGDVANAKPDIRKTGGTKSVAAFDAYLRGKDLFEAGIDEASDRLALAKFDEAIAADGKYAAAHAARSRSMAIIANLHAKGEELQLLYRGAVVSAQRAVELAPEYAEAHSALGFALAFGKMDMRAARQPYETSLRLGGGDADILSRYAIFNSRLKRFDAANKAITRSLALDPLNARTFRTIGAINYAAGNYAGSVDALKRALALNPKLGGANAVIAQAQYMLGEIDAAETSYTAETNGIFGLAGLAIVAHRKGKVAEAQQAFDKLVAEHGSNSLYQQAQVYAQWGDVPKGMQALLDARAAGDSGLIQMYYDPLLNPLRKEPEFSRLLKDIGFV